MPWTQCWTLNLVLLVLNVALLIFSLYNALFCGYYWKLVVARLRRYPEAALAHCDARVRLSHLQEFAPQAQETDLPTCPHLFA